MNDFKKAYILFRILINVTRCWVNVGENMSGYGQ